MSAWFIALTITFSTQKLHLPPWNFKLLLAWVKLQVFTAQSAWFCPRIRSFAKLWAWAVRHISLFRLTFGSHSGKKQEFFLDPELVFKTYVSNVFIESSSWKIIRLRKEDGLRVGVRVLVKGLRSMHGGFTESPFLPSKRAPRLYSRDVPVAVKSFWAKTHALPPCKGRIQHKSQESHSL